MKKLTLSRAALRRLIDQALGTDPDLNAFCLDYFTAIYRQWTIGMDRRTKINLLLEKEEPEVVLERIRQTNDSLVMKFLSNLNEDTSRIEKFSAYRTQLELLYEQREAISLSGGQTHHLDQEIVKIRRQQRDAPQLNEGEIVADRYRLIEIVGRGGFANVWQAYDRKNRMIVAVKVLHPHFADESSHLERFCRGGQQMAKLIHPNIARVLHEPAEYERFHFFVMEYLSGGDLASAVINGKLDQNQSLNVIFQTCDALHYAHSRGLIHRDVKPQNILLDEFSRARLTDFDLVHANDTTGGTRTGAMVGTFMYAAPEQLSDAAHVDARADLFSIGICTVFVLYGKSLPHTALRNLDSLIESLNCCKDVKTVLHSAVAWSPEDRLESVMEFKELLQAAFNEAKDLDVTHNQLILSNQTKQSNQNIESSSDKDHLEITTNPSNNESATTRQSQDEIPKSAVLGLSTSIQEADQPSHQSDSIKQEATPSKLNKQLVAISLFITLCLGSAVFVWKSCTAPDQSHAQYLNSQDMILPKWLASNENIPTKIVAEPKASVSAPTGDKGSNPNKYGASSPGVVLGTAEVRGSLDKELIRRIIRRHINEVKFCYEKELVRNSKLAGRVMIQFTIISSGAVAASIVQSSTMDNPVVEQCIAAAIRRWEFPKPQGGIVVVTYPFELNPAFTHE